jgi:hypothetical protein
MKHPKHRLIVIALILTGSLNAFSAERPGKAVYETSEEQGMRLTEKALKNIEVSTLPFKEPGNDPVPLASLVYFQGKVGVYRLRHGWFKLISVQVVKKDDREAVIRSGDLLPGDEIVSHGADLLRVSELDAFGSGE